MKQIVLMAKYKLTEFYEDSLVLVHGNFSEVLSYKDLDWVLVPIFRNLLTHEMGLEKRNINHEQLTQTENAAHNYILCIKISNGQC